MTRPIIPWMLPGIFLLIPIFCCTLIFPGCGNEKIENKNYVAEQVTLMFEGVSRDPMGDSMRVLEKMGEMKTASDLMEMNDQSRAEKSMIEEFNASFAMKASNDPVLKKYFDSFCRRHAKGKSRSLSSFDFYDYGTRISLEKELGIDIVDTPSLD